MKVIAFNGGPRKTWNTATLLGKALEGAASRGAETKLVHLYDYKYTGCKSCFACKTRGGRSYGKCGARDELTPLLDEAAAAQAILVGSPIYFGAVSGELKSFMERLMFPYLVYDADHSSIFPRTLPVGVIHTMNVPERDVDERGYRPHLDNNERFFKRVFGFCETLLSCDTYQFDDYSKMVADGFDAAKKAQRRKEVFPQDCQRAFDLGARLVGAATAA